MSITTFNINSGADLLQTHYDDRWNYGSSSYNNQYYPAGGTHGYCSGNKHRAVFKIKIPSAANSPLKKGYLTFNFNGVVSSSGSRTLNYVLTSTAPPSPGSADGTIPTTYYRKGTVSFSGLTKLDKQLSFTIGSESDLFTIPAANEYMYLWLYNDSGSAMECYIGTSYYSVKLYAQMVGAPSAPTKVWITENSSNIYTIDYIKPGQQVKIRWTGAAAGTGGSIVGYRIWYRESTATAATSKDISLNTPSGTYTLTVPSYTRGNSLVVSVGTLGSENLSSSTNTRTDNQPIINKLPIISSVSLDKNSLVTSKTLYGDSASFNVYFSGSRNGDSQALIYYYSTSTSGTRTKIAEGESITFTNDNQSSVTKTYYFWAYDGLEYSSSYKTINVTLISNLTLELNSISHTTISALDGTKYLKNSFISIKTNRTSIDAFNEIKVSLNDKKLNSSYYSYKMNSSNLEFTLDFYKTNLILKDGDNTLQFSIIPKDGTTPSPEIVHFNTNDSGIIFTSLGDFNLNYYSTGDIRNRLCYNYITLDVNKIKTLESKATSIILYRGIKTSNSNDFNYTSLNYIIDNDNVSNVLEGTKIKYKVIVTNPYGIQTIFEQTSDLEIQKLYRPIITNFSYTNLLNPYKPLNFIDDGTKLKIVIYNSEIKINNELVSGGNVNYPKKWYFNLVNSSGENIGSSIELTGIISDSGEVSFEIPNSTIIDLINNNYSSFKIGTTTMGFSISCVDEYDLESNKLTKSNILSIDFNEAPSFGDKTFTLEHLMFTDKNNEEITDDIKNKTFMDVKDVENGHNYQKVNPYEWIRITAPEVTDLNQVAGAESSDNFTYKLYRALITEVTGDYILFKTQTGDKTFYFKSDDYYSEFVKYKYKIEVYDTQGLSDTCYSGLDDYDLIFFPTNPLSNFNELIDFKDGTIKLTLEDDLCGYSPYSNYLNLWRGEDGYEKDFKVHFVKSINYTDLENLSKNPSEITTISNDKTSADVSQGATIQLSLGKNTEVTTYYLVILQISTGLKLDDNSINYIYTTSPIYSVDPNAPTVAVRKGYLGINCKHFDNTQLIKIQAPSTGDRMKIVFIREGANEVKVSINLADGSIDGATISGGEW